MSGLRSWFDQHVIVVQVPVPPAIVTTGVEYPHLIAAAQRYAAKVGVGGKSGPGISGGGWLYDARGRVVCQGWASFAGILVADGIIRHLSGARLATRTDNQRGLRNAFDRKPVVLTERLRRSDAIRADKALRAL